MPSMKHLTLVIALLLVADAASAFDKYAGLDETEHQPSDLSKALNLIMSTITPNLYFHQRELMVDAYERSELNKALVANIEKQAYWETAGQDSKLVTGERALEGCQLRFESPCKLLAVNDEIAKSAGPNAEQDMPRLKYSGGFDVDKLPIVKDVLRKRVDVQSYLSTQRPKAIAIHPLGQMIVVSGFSTDREAADAALARCDFAPGRKKSDGPCYLYSVNNDVVISQRRTFPSMF
jgi:hypothetical protein